MLLPRLMGYASPASENAASLSSARNRMSVEAREKTQQQGGHSHFSGEDERGVASGEFENQKSGNSAEHKQERFVGSAHRDGGIAGNGQGCLRDRTAEKSAESEKQAVHAAGCCAGSFSLMGTSINIFLTEIPIVSV